MSEPVHNPTPTPRRRWNRPLVVSIVLAILLVAMVLGYYFFFPSEIGVAQPIAFSHRIHVTEKRVSCVMCHTGPLDTPRSGVPPVQTCILCHERIITTHPQIVKLRDYWQREKPVPWVRVNDVPDFVFFNHEVHLRKGFDCGKCHGEVSQMDRVAMPWKLNMGFCVQCHRDNKASHDCGVCHR